MRSFLAAAAAALALAWPLGTRSPFMGFNTWNAFFCNYNATDVMAMADIMASEGYLAAGYRVLALDDCWQSARNATGGIIPDPSKFPDGIEPVIAYAASKGLGFGLYSDAGTETCAGRPGGLGHETIDAQTYAQWGVEFLKYDNCNNENIDPHQRYEPMSNALLAAYNAAGKNMTFGACIWGVSNPWTWMGPVANHWRIDDDVAPNWDTFLRVLGNGEGLAKYAGPGQWNDFDMLETGNSGLSDSEGQAMFALWAIMKSPLLIGTDLRKASAATKATLLATEVIAINQDALMVAGDLVWRNGPNRIYAAPMYAGDRAVVMFNAHTHADQYPTYNVTLDFSMIGYNATTTAVVRDLFAQQDVGTFTGNATLAVPLHGVRALRVTPTNAAYLDTTWRPWVAGTWSH